jgi:hypothetical protein
MDLLIQYKAPGNRLAFVLPVLLYGRTYVMVGGGSSEEGQDPQQ